MTTWLKPMLTALFEHAPEAIELVERIVRDEKAKRVEQIRPEQSHSQRTIDELVEQADRRRVNGETD